MSVIVSLILLLWKLEDVRSFNLIIILILITLAMKILGEDSKLLIPVADPRRRPEGAMAPLREETAINKAYELLLQGTKITETT